MIEENGRSRIYLGVHWIFDAFVVTDKNEADLYRKNGDGNPFGGVPLGLLIAEDIFQAGDGKAPKKPAVDAPPLLISAPEARTETFSSSFQPATPSK
jgi:vanadium chloroperoxidase